MVVRLILSQPLVEFVFVQVASAMSEFRFSGKNDKLLLSRHELAFRR